MNDILDKDEVFINYYNTLIYYKLTIDEAD